MTYLIKINSATGLYSVRSTEHPELLVGTGWFLETAISDLEEQIQKTEVEIPKAKRINPRTEQIVVVPA